MHSLSIERNANASQEKGAVENFARGNKQCFFEITFNVGNVMWSKRTTAHYSWESDATFSVFGSEVQKSYTLKMHWHILMSIRT